MDQLGRSAGIESRKRRRRQTNVPDEILATGCVDSKNIESLDIDGQATEPCCWHLTRFQGKGCSAEQKVG